MYTVTLQDKSTVTIDDNNFELFKKGMSFEDTDGCLIQWYSVESICEGGGDGGGDEILEVQGTNEGNTAILNEKWNTIYNHIQNGGTVNVIWNSFTCPVISAYEGMGGYFVQTGEGQGYFSSKIFRSVTENDFPMWIDPED